jgi:hypothetical protein
MLKILPHINLSPKEFATLIRKFFTVCDSRSPKTPYTATGLALHLDWTPDDLITFPHDSPLFPFVEKALLECEEALIQSMLSGKLDRATGVLLLTNHFGYRNKMDAPVVQVRQKTISEVLDELEAKHKKD